MTKMYSPSTGGFYIHEIHKEGIPSDAFEVDEIEEKEIKGRELEHKKGQRDKNGRLKFVEKKVQKGVIEDEIKRKRNSLLRETDWTQIPDCPLAGNQEILDYRQALRDISLQKGFPNNINWPEKPDVL